MKRLLWIITLVLFHLSLFAQNPNVQHRLESRYSLVRYHKECGGWYFLSYSKGGQQFYGFADNNGNVVAQDADKYRMHPGYVELHLLDKNQAALHAQWKNDMKSYEHSNREYLRVEKAYDAEMAAYKAKVKLAESEAKKRQREAQAHAKAQAARETQRLQQETANAVGGGIWGALAGMAVGGAVKAVTAATIPYEPFLAEVLAERDLTVEPVKPYNPKPVKPVEPSDGFYWKSFSLRQPCRYEEVDFASIAHTSSFADVRHDGKWGMVDSYMNEVIPCVNTEKVIQRRYDDGMVLVRSLSKCGIIDSKGKYILPLKFRDIERVRNRFKVAHVSGCGLYSTEGKEIIPCRYKELKFQQGYWLCCDNDRWGVYTADCDGLLYPCQFQDAKLVWNGDKLMLYNKSKGLWGVIDFLAGTELLPNMYSSVEFSDLGDVGLFYKVCGDSKYGLYSDKGVVVIPCSYSGINIKDVAGRKMIEVCDGESVGLYETTGIEVLPSGRYLSYKYKDFYYEVSGPDGKIGVCDRIGRELLPCRYTKVEHNDRINAFMASKGGLKGVVSMQGRELFPFVNTGTLELHPLCPDVFVVGTGGSKGYGAMDYRGRLIVPMKNKYDKLARKVDKFAKKNPISGTTVLQKKILADDARSKQEMEALGLDERDKFSFYAQNYVERVIGEWQKKGEFEKLDDWRKRVNRNTMNQRIYALTKEAQTAYVDQFRKNMPKDFPEIIGTYDPDNETYRISTEYAGEDILVKVDSKDALEFKTGFGALKKSPVFFVENDRIGLAEYVFTMPDGTKYKYSNQASLTYTIADVQYNIDAIEIDKSVAGNVGKRGTQTISTSTIAFGRADVDMNIPVSEIKRPNTFVVIIANENYDNESRVDFAYNDGQAFREYCTKTLGVPAENIHFRPDATLNHMKFEVGWLKTVTKAFPDAKVLFYYAGHGMPDAYSRESFLLPVDGYDTDLGMTGYKLSELYSSLGELPAQSVLVMLDACFSGVDRGGRSMTNVRAAKVTLKKDRPAGNVVVFSATSGQQVAYPYSDQSHGMFTYFLLKKLQESHGNVNYGELFDYVSTNVAQRVSVVNNTEQTPTVMPAPVVASSWKNLTL